MSSATAPPPRPTTAGPSLRPALVVVAVALVIVVGGAILALAGTSSARQGATYGPSQHLSGSPLRAQSASAALSHIESDGEPPPDVISALEVPATSVYVSRLDEDAGVSQFDRSVSLSVERPVALVRRFFVALLSDRRWVTDSVTTGRHGAIEIIAQRNGSDGYQWRVGVSLSEAHAAVTAALGGGDSALATSFTIRLYQVADAS